MTGNGSPLDGIGRFSIVSLSFRVCAKANVGLMRAAPTPAASRKKLVRDKSLVSKDFELRRIVKRFLCTWCISAAANQPARAVVRRVHKVDRRRPCLFPDSLT